MQKNARRSTISMLLVVVMVFSLSAGIMPVATAAPPTALDMPGVEQISFDVNNAATSTVPESSVSKLEYSASVVIASLDGAGTAADPYQIGSKEELVFAIERMNANDPAYTNTMAYELTADIDMDNDAGFTPIITFRGVLDGQGHVIKNLYVYEAANAPLVSPQSGQHRIAFIRTLSGGKVLNIVFENPTVESYVTQISGGSSGAAVIACVMDSYALVDSCVIANATVYSPNLTKAGGVSMMCGVEGTGVARGGRGTISNCIVDGADITCRSRNSTTASTLGGIVGYSIHAIIINNIAKDINLTHITPTNNQVTRFGMISAIGGNTLFKNNIALNGTFNYSNTASPGEVFWDAICPHVDLTSSYGPCDFIDNLSCLDSITAGPAAGSTAVANSKNTGESGAGTILPAEAFKLKQTYDDIGWDFSGYWEMEDGYAHPVLNFSDSGPGNPKPVVPLDVSYLSLSPGTDATQLNFSWHTAKRAASPIVSIWKSGAAAVEYTGTSSVSTSAISNMYYNRVTVTGLEANTVYTYRLGDGDSAWSDEYTTKTGNCDAFSYIVVGDPQIGSSGSVTNDTTNWVNTMNVIKNNYPGAAFMVGTGDQVETSGNLSHYTGFFTPMQMASLPFATCVGNHEGAGTAPHTFYNPPNADSVQNYWYRFGDALFIVWNCTNGNAASMRAFLTSAIAANQDAKWRILSFHYDVYGQGTSHALSDGKNYRDIYVPVIDEFDIDVVFNGHDHAYSRSYPMKWSGSAATSNNAGMQSETFGPNGESIDPAGTVYFSLNSATGSKYYALTAQQPYTAAMNQANRPNFSVVEMTANTFTCTTYQININNSLNAIDTYTILKTSHEIPPVDKTALSSLIIVAETLVRTDYTESSWALFEAAIANARSTAANEAATQDEVNDAVTELQTKMDNLVSITSRNNLVSVRANETTAITNPAEYIISIRNACDAMIVSLEFEADGNILSCSGVVMQTLNGFIAMNSGDGAIKWISTQDGIFTGAITLMYFGDNESLTSVTAIDIVKFLISAKAYGSATIKLTKVEISGIVDEEVVWLDSVIEKAEASTMIIESKYDLNKDGVIDQLDLTIILVYCQYNEDDGEWWNTLFKVKDSRGGGITANLCDFDGNGVVNMVDIVELFLNYTVG